MEWLTSWIPIWLRANWELFSNVFIFGLAWAFLQSSAGKDQLGRIEVHLIAIVFLLTGIFLLLWFRLPNSN